MPGIVQSVVRAPESTTNVDLNNNLRRVRDVSREIMYLDPDAAPLTVASSREQSQSTSNSKFEWMEKGLPARWDADNGTTGTGTSVTVNNAKFFSVGDLVAVPRTKERMIVTAVNTGTNVLTVTRGVGILAAQALADKDDLLIIGNAYLEGDVSGTPKSVLEDFRYNYTQIIRTPFGATGTEMNSENYTGPDRTRLRMEKGVEHKIDIERTGLFGERNIDTSSADNPRRYTGGLLYFLEAHDLTGVPTAQIKDFSGTASEPEIEDWLQTVFGPTGAGDSRTLLASPLWVSIFDQIAAQRIMVVDRSETYGVTVRQWVTAHGTLNIVKHRLLENNPAPTATSPSGFAGYALAVDFTRIKYRFLNNRNTKLSMDIQANDYDGFKDEYMTECGWQVGLPQVHGIGKNATG
jgi:hypothetical protein